jgi:hypothetical protein
VNALTEAAGVVRRTGEVFGSEPSSFLRLGYPVRSKWMAKGVHLDEVVSEVEDHAEPDTSDVD